MRLLGFLGALITANILLLNISFANPQGDMSWFKNGNPYQIAVHCYAVVLLNPDIEYNGEEENLLNIIASDPHLDADISLDKSIYAYPTERARLLNLVSKNLNTTVFMIQHFDYDLKLVNDTCINFIKRSL